MRPTQFSADTVVALLRKQTVVSLTDVMAAFGPRVSRRTAFRKLKDLDAHTSYSHRGGYYTLDELADFDEHGLWAFAGVRFSRAGTLVATAEAFVNHAEAGHFVDELDNLLGVGTQDALRKLVGDGRLTRHKLEVAPVSWTPILLGGEGVSAMPKTRPPYAAEFRQQMVDLVRSGRAPEDLAREFEPSSQAIRTWVAQAGRDAGERSDGLRTEEREELRRLRRENRRLCEEREILAKATAWFAREARPGRPTGS